MTERVRCIRCGKVVRDQDPRMVQMSVLLTLWTERHAPALEPALDQGWFPVGSDCYRKVDAAGAAGLDLNATDPGLAR